MNYAKNYNDYISYVKTLKRTKRKKDDVNYIYYEIHHIVPRCMGGLDIEENLVLLTAREHFLAHYVLLKIYKNTIFYPKLCFAFNQFLTFKSENQDRIYNSKMYSHIKNKLDLSQSIEARSKMSEHAKTRIGGKNPFYGKKHTNETLLKQSQIKKDAARKEDYINGWKGKHWSEEEKIRLSKLKLGISLSPEHKNNISEGLKKSPESGFRTANSGRKWCNNGVENIFLNKNQAIPEGYCPGRFIKPAKPS